MLTTKNLSHGPGVPYAADMPSIATLLVLASLAQSAPASAPLICRGAAAANSDSAPCQPRPKLSRAPKAAVAAPVLPRPFRLALTIDRRLPRHVAGAAVR